jgi:hypothetical protein
MKINYEWIIFLDGNRDCSVGIAMGYGMDGWGSIPRRGRDFPLFHSVQTVFGLTQPPI